MFIRGVSWNKFRCSSLLLHRSYLVFASQYSTEQLVVNTTKINSSTSSECRILNQLCDIFPISIRSPSDVDSSCNQLDVRAADDFSIRSPSEVDSSCSQLGIRAADDFLPPEDKLRGVFLQKLPSKVAIHSALSGVGVELNDEVFSKVVNMGDLSGEAMLVFFNWAIEQPNLSKGVGAFHIVLKALGRRKSFVHMMEIVKDMGNRGVTVNSETLFIVMDSYLRAHRVSKATTIFGELEKYGLECNMETLRVALSCLSQRSHVGTACLLFNRMREKVQCDGSMYNIIIGGWSKLGKVTEVEKFLKLMVDDGVEPNCVTHSYVIEGFGRAGRFDDAIRIFNFLEEKGSRLSSEVYDAMIFNCIANHDISGALKFHEGMVHDGFEPSVDTYVRIILYFLKRRRVSDAIELLDVMLGRGVIPSTGALTEILKPLCSYGPPYAALMVYNKARKAGCRVSMTGYKLLLMRLSRFGKCGMLLKMWEEMQESGYGCDMQVYEYLINGLCNTGRLESAVLVMEECISKGLFPSKIISSKLYNRLMDSNKVDVAYKLFLKLRNARLNENAQRYWRAKGWHF
ncbi:putative pentatricopeptide repeat-containing protein At5g43820 [Salvia hispanica]|uniref:putative pentatricopeptide repeat-containing protein At5g43820 n=1 Tax=Salvia hispanica TaxID=49212 RepID=UPI002009B7B3|nr:putative pentatricopeptide repeat-containing protein At5g43820 [Salvia hispanica]XP_047941031.1 putative pentatricopeptide repeat-containing protein At5g43820 [Salvia hispanica]